MRGKGVCFILPLMLFFSFASLCPADSAWGLKAGVNVSSFGGEGYPTDVDDFKLGFLTGIFISYDVTDLFSIEPSILYHVKGAVFWENSGSNVSGKRYDDLTYLEIPLAFRLHFRSRDREVRPNFLIGPYFAYLLSSKYRATGGLAEEYGSMGYLVGVKKYDYGYFFGFGCDFWKFSIDLYYSQGLTTIDDTDTSTNIYNRLFAVALGFKI
jgi:hypothetical protein